MLIAFFVSVGLWFYVVTVENPVKEIKIANVPVVFAGEDVLREEYDLLVVDSNVINGVELTFTGKISDLNKLQQGSADMALNVDVSRLRAPSTVSLSYDAGDVSLPAGLSGLDVTLAVKEPSTVSVTLEKLARKTVPVDIKTSVSLADGFITGSLTRSYEEIVIEGPEALIKQVSKAQAVLERSNADQKISANLPLSLVDADGNLIENRSLILETDTVDVTLAVLMFKNVPLEAAVIDGGGATKDDAVIEIEPKTIQLSGEAAALESVQSIVLSNINLAALMSNDEVLTRAITKPEGCTNVSGESEAKVSVKIKNKAIRKLVVSSSNFQEMGLPSDRTVVYKTTALPITVRAGEADIDQLTDANVRVVVDFSGMSSSLGTNISMPVRIYIDGFEGAGVITDTEQTVLLDITEGSGAGS